MNSFELLILCLTGIINTMIFRNSIVTRLGSAIQVKHLMLQESCLKKHTEESVCTLTYMTPAMCTQQQYKTKRKERSSFKYVCVRWHGRRMGDMIFVPVFLVRVFGFVKYSGVKKLLEYHGPLTSDSCFINTQNQLFYTLCLT